MPKITYVHVDGTRTTLEVAIGTSLMQAAVAHGLAGIVAECGGSAMCATCHVYVEEQLLSLLEPVAAVEDAMLDSTACQRKPNSRLSCQLMATEAMDGLVVHLPEAQT
jgi:ferredoxin, 2Fe-2S